MEIAASILEVTGDERKPLQALARLTFLFASGSSPYTGPGDSSQVATLIKTPETRERQRDAFDPATTK